jgi:hypothetical protein
MVFEHSSGVREIADELLYRERQLPFDAKLFCEGTRSRRSKSFAIDRAHSSHVRLHLFPRNLL